MGAPVPKNGCTCCCWSCWAPADAAGAATGWQAPPSAMLLLQPLLLLLPPP